MLPRATAEFHVFDYGTIIQAEVRNGRNQRVDVSGAFLVAILFMRPDGSGFSREAVLGGAGGSPIMSSSMGSSSMAPLPGQDGLVHYVIQEGDLDVEGQWYLQFYLEIGGGAWFSSVVAFTVLPNIISPGTVLSP